MYLDSSVIVKALINEPDSARWRSVISQGANHQTSVIALVEVRSALRQKVLLGAFDSGAAQRIWQQFLQDTRGGQLLTLPFGQDVIEESAKIFDSLSPTIPLRSLDAIHLATLRLANAQPLATNDSRMLAAAKALGIAVV